MGTQYMFKCNKCGYQVISSGGRDCGFLAVVDTYLCKSCEKIVDVCIGEYGQAFSKEEVLIKKSKPETDMDFYKCPEYGSDDNLVKWNKNMRPCPKCDGQMVKDIAGEIIMWD